jgi:6-pyruvoyltetrahydropterin/6-carboxytetrahydropterin synthase
MTHSDPTGHESRTESTTRVEEPAQSEAPARPAGGGTATPYKLTVTRKLVAQHFLTVPDPGPEGVPHSHRFQIEVRFGGPELNEYGYLVNIDAVNELLDRLEERYRDSLLNDLPEFEGLNPSVEHFSRLFGDRVQAGLSEPTPTRLTVRIWEDDTAWASHQRSLE